MHTVVVAGLKCAECGYSCHEKCMSHVPKNCSSGRSRNEAGSSSSNTNSAGVASTHAAQSPSDGESSLSWTSGPLVGPLVQRCSSYKWHQRPSKIRSSLQMSLICAWNIHVYNIKRARTWKILLLQYDMYIQDFFRWGFFLSCLFSDFHCIWCTQSC